jgi:sensitive to high expression protein 9
MSIIRSEHANDQAVQAAKDTVSAAEKSLEEARTRLEKRERMQYHEEQVWSDTIRRNSTWVTFGLMGVNIILLLASLVIFEPWRRRRMVKEIRAALEEHKPIMSVMPGIEKETDGPVEPVQPVAVALESIPGPPPQAPEDSTVTAAISSQPEVPITEDINAVSSTEIEKLLEKESSLVGTSEWSFEGLKHNIQQLFSEQQVVVRRVDVTTVVLEGAAAGAAVVGFVGFLILRSR